MKMTMERYVQLLNTKMNLKTEAEKLGFKKINDVLYTREKDGAYIKFDDEEIDVWIENVPRKRVSQYYNMIRTEIDKGFYTEKTYLQYTLDNIKHGKW